MTETGHKIETAWMRPEARRGRGARSNAAGRFEPYGTAGYDDGWSEEAPAPLRTEVTVERPRTIIARNSSPDIPFDRSINPYRGCEHGCIYCYARPTHGHMGLSAGLDFETRLFAKPDAPDLLRKELAKARYEPRPIAIGTNTDPYQPIEAEWRIMRGILEVLEEARHPVTIVTKSALVLRDLDILGRMAVQRLAKVAISVTTLDHRLARRMEPRASTPKRRLAAIAALAGAGVPTGVMTAPLIPGLNDHEIEAILTAARKAGAAEAGWVMLRLPHEIKDLFREWLEEEAPDRAGRVLSLVRQVRSGRDNDPRFAHRMRGAGPVADMIGHRFRLAVRRLGFNQADTKLETGLFVRPRDDGTQMSLF